MSGLVFAGVRVAAGARVLIDAFDLAVAPGEIATVMGASGAGKSSLLAYACGTLAPGLSARGSVRLDGVEIGGLPPERRRIGILFQDDLLFPHLSVGANLGFGLRAEAKDRRARIDAAPAACAGKHARAPGATPDSARGRARLTLEGGADAALGAAARAVRAIRAVARQAGTAAAARAADRRTDAKAPRCRQGHAWPARPARPVGHPTRPCRVRRAPRACRAAAAERPACAAVAQAKSAPPGCGRTAART